MEIVYDDDDYETTTDKVIYDETIARTSMTTVSTAEQNIQANTSNLLQTTDEYECHDLGQGVFLPYLFNC